MKEHQPSQDPLGLGAVDRAIRLNELEERVKELGPGSLHVGEECPSGVHEQFLRNVLDYDAAPVGTRFRQLVDAGVALPRPETLDGAALTAKLWEVIRALAALDVYLHHTDHLSDRQLYEHLWRDSLREETAIFPPGSGWIGHIDLIGGGSDEDIEIGLRYYDDESQRRHWAEDFPNDVIPPHEDPPHARDRALPQEPPPGPAPEDGDFDEDDGGEEEEWGGGGSDESE
jgi:hypothetical protein